MEALEQTAQALTFVLKPTRIVEVSKRGGGLDGRFLDCGMRFLCDEMLHRLGRWLRAGGHDTEIAKAGGPDGPLLHLALAEDRKLLTRDRAILQRKRAGEVVVLLYSDKVHEQAAHLGRMLGVDWLANPFSRCMICNTELKAASPAAAEMAPAKCGRQICRSAIDGLWASILAGQP